MCKCNKRNTTTKVVNFASMEMVQVRILQEVRLLLDEKAEQYNKPSFIEHDPIQIPHLFTLKEDIEVAGFLTATIAWGNRKSIIQNAHKLMHLMGHQPYAFIMDATERQVSRLTFVHRTFNSDDLQFFVYGLRNIYRHHKGMQAIFEQHATAYSTQPAITAFKRVFFSIPHPTRTQKHVSDPEKGSSAKRLNMMLRWFVRKDHAHVDLGIWKGRLQPHQLSLPLDVHTGNIARKLGLLNRKMNDAKALAEIDAVLRQLDVNDPVKYDYALFGLGAFEGF